MNNYDYNLRQISVIVDLSMFLAYRNNSNNTDYNIFLSFSLAFNKYCIHSWGSVCGLSASKVACTTLFLQLKYNLWLSIPDIVDMRLVHLIILAALLRYTIIGLHIVFPWPPTNEQFSILFFANLATMLWYCWPLIGAPSAGPCKIFTRPYVSWEKDLVNKCKCDVGVKNSGGHGVQCAMCKPIKRPTL